MRLSKLFIISVLFIIGYLILISYPYFFSKINRFDSLGLLSVVDEKPINIQKTITPSQVTDQFDRHLLKGEKLKGEFTASENNFGILLVKFIQLSAKVSDNIVFRIKEKDKSNWYYENGYKANQFQPDQYFTFGFPPIINSKNNAYVFEIESLSGTYKNGVGLSEEKPQTALVYKYSTKELRNYKILFPFILAKFIYVAENVNFLQNWQILVIFVLSFFLVIFMRKRKITVHDILRFLPILKKDHAKILKAIINKVGFNYFYIEKKMIVLLNRISHRFTSTKFYLQVLNTNTKKTVAISLLIFLLAFTYRFSSVLVNQSHSWVGSYQTTFFYAGLGGQGDYDQFIRAATCAITNFCSAILGQNFLIEASFLGIFYKIFGFTEALKVYLFLMLILSSSIAVIPYLLLSRKNWISLGGILGSLFLATSDFLTHISLNFPPDNGSLFTFSLFYIFYFLTLQRHTIRWFLFFGLMGTFDGLNKALFLINDLVAFALFVPVFFYKNAKKINGSLFKRKNIKLLFLSSLPLLVFLTIYIGWEYLVYIKFSAYYFLRGLLQSGGSSYISYTSLNDSSSHGNVVLGLLYLIVQGIIMLKHLIEYADLRIIFLAPIFFGMLFFSFIKADQRSTVKKFVLLFILSIFLIALMKLIKNDYYKIHEIFNGDYIYSWTEQTYMGIFLFLEIIALFILNFGYSAIRLSLPIIPYIVMLIIMAKNAPFARLHTHVVAWSIILLAFLIEWMMISVKKYSAKIRNILAFSVFILFILFYLFPKLIIAVDQINIGTAFNNNEIKYLSWVEENLPTNAVVLAGGKSDLVSVAENIRRPIIYNTLWSAAVLIGPKEVPGVKATDFNALNILKINEISGVRPNDFYIISELRNKNNFKKKKYIILEDDVYLWRDRVTGVADNVFASDSKTLLHGENYSVKVYKYNPILKKAIYELDFVGSR